MTGPDDGSEAREAYQRAVQLFSDMGVTGDATRAELDKIPEAVVRQFIADMLYIVWGLDLRKPVE